MEDECESIRLELHLLNLTASRPSLSGCMFAVPVRGGPSRGRPVILPRCRRVVRVRPRCDPARPTGRSGDQSPRPFGCPSCFGCVLAMSRGFACCSYGSSMPAAWHVLQGIAILQNRTQGVPAIDVLGFRMRVTVSPACLGPTTPPSLYGWRGQKSRSGSVPLSRGSGGGEKTPP